MEAIGRIVSKEINDRKPCQDCEGRGWLFNSGSYRIERCDLCESYRDDYEAAMAFSEDVWFGSGEKVEVSLKLSHRLPDAGWMVEAETNTTLPEVVASLITSGAIPSFKEAKAVVANALTQIIELTTTHDANAIERIQGLASQALELV